MRKRKGINELVIPGIIVAIVFLLMIVRGAPIIPSFFSAGIILMIMVLSQKTYQAKYLKATRKRYAFMTEERAFNNTIYVLIAAIVKADGKSSPEEFKYIRKSLSLHFKEQSVDRQMAYIKKLAAADDFQINGVCHFINMNYLLPEKIQLLHFLTGIITANGLLTEKEQNYLYDICMKIKVPPTSLKGIYRMFDFLTEEELKNRQKRKEEKTVRSSSFQIAKSLEILGLNSNATDKEIKKAYRKLAKLHHPDKLIHLGKEHQKSAEEKFLAISDAYEYLKSVKGFN